MLFVTLGLGFLSSRDSRADGAVGEELAPNGGFEEWGPDPGNGLWLVKGSEKAPVTKAYRTGDGELDTTRHSGQYAQYVFCDKYPQGLGAGCPAQPGHHYKFSAWVKLGAGGSAWVHVISIPTYHNPLNESAAKIAPGDWQKVETTVTCPEGESAIQFNLFILGAAYVDDMSLKEVAEGPPVPVAILQAINKKKGIKDESPKGTLAAVITRKRIAIFSEPGFPSSSPRPAEWYVTTLADAGLKPAVIGVGPLSSPSEFSRDKFDTLLIATGGNLPLSAEENISRFLEAGGAVVADGSLFAADEPDTIYNFTSPQVSAKPGRMFQQDASGKWGAVRCPWWGLLFYYNQSEDFNLMLIKDGWRKLPGDAVPNPAFKDFLPPDLPAKIHAEKGWAVRVESINAGWAATTPADVTELIHNILLPIYTFTDAATPEQAATDFFICRYHSLRKNGATLLQFGEIGKAGLAAEGGNQLLIAMLKLAESRLPGEFEDDFYTRRNEFRAAVSDFYRAWCDAYYAVKDAILVSHYLGRAEDCDALIVEYKALEDLVASVVKTEVRLKELDKYHDLSADALRREWLPKLKDGMARLEKSSSQWSAAVQAHARVPAVVRAKQLPYEMSFYADCGPSGAMGMRHFCEAMKEQGAISSFGHYMNGQPVHGPRLFKEFGIGWEHCFTGQDGYALPKARGLFDPKTLKVEENGETGGYLFKDYSEDTPKMNDFKAMLDDMKARGGLPVARWTAEHAPGGGYYGPVFYAWGPGFDPIFQEHLRNKYGTIATLNKLWQTNFSGFEEVKVPLKLPATPQEHALWEDWTKLREDNYLVWVEKTTGILRKQLPGIVIFNGANTPGSANWPAVAMNYYRISKYYDIIGTHSYNVPPQTQWALVDFIEGKKPYIDDEWGGIFLAGNRYDETVKLSRDSRWRDMSAGQAGFTFFGFCWPGFDNLQFIDWEGMLRLNGWDLQHWAQEGRRLGHILLDGERAAPQVGILYSLTNLRHAAMPDSPMPVPAEASGFSHICLEKQLPAHVLTEEKVLDGLPITEKVLVLPGIEFVPEALWTKVEEWIRNGGHLIATLPAATSEAYGQRHDYVLSLAGLATVKPAKPTIPGDGWVYFSRMKENEMRGFREVLPGQREILFSYASGEPAVVRAQVGKGTVTVMGMPFGRDFEDFGSEQPAAAIAIFDQMIAPSGITPTLFADDPHLLLREWSYGGERYVFVYSARDAGMSPVSFEINGSWRVEDYLLGMNVPVSRANGRTRVSGYLQTPGGLVYRLKPETRWFRSLFSRDESAASARKEVAAKPATKESAAQSAIFPYAGFLEVDKNRAEVEGYVFHAESAGSGSPVSLVARHAGQTLRLAPEPNGSYKLWFKDSVLDVEVLKICKTQPIGCEIKVARRERPAAMTGCRLREEKFFTRDSIVLENGLVRVRVIPELGGRICELSLLPEEQNQVKLDAAVRKALSNPGAGSPSYEYGGLDEHDAMDWMGSLHRTPFKSEIIENTPQRIVLRLSGKGLKVTSANREIATVDIRKEITLEDGQSAIGMETSMINTGGDEKELGLLIRPMLAVGGEADDADVAYVPTEKGVSAYPYRMRTTVPEIYPDQGWAGFVDPDRGVAYVSTFDLAKTAHVYLWMGAPGYKPDAYNLEVKTKDLAASPGGAVKFPLRYGFLRGLPALHGAGETVAGGLVLSSTTAEQGVKLDGQLVLSSFLTERRAYDIRLKLTQPGADFSREILTAKLEVDHFHPATAPFTVETVGLKDGNYLLTADVVDAGNVTVATLRQVLTLAGEKGQEARLMLANFEKRLDAVRAKLAKQDALTTEQRQKIVRGYMLLEELRTAGEKQNTANVEPIKLQLQTILEQPEFQ